MSVDDTDDGADLMKPPRWTFLRAMALVACVAPFALQRDALTRPAFDAEFLSTTGVEAMGAPWRETPATLDRDPSCPPSKVEGDRSIATLGADISRCVWSAGPLHMESTLARWHVAMVSAAVAPLDRQQIIPALPADGRCALDTYAQAARSGHRVAVVSPREVLMACDHPDVFNERPWCVRLSPRAVRAPWAAALLASATLALAAWWIALTWRRAPLRRLPWRVARRDADGHLRLADGTVVHHAPDDPWDDVVFVLASASPMAAPYRSSYGVTAERGCTPLAWRALAQAADRRRWALAGALGIAACVVATLAHELR